MGKGICCQDTLPELNPQNPPNAQPGMGRVHAHMCVHTHKKSFMAHMHLWKKDGYRKPRVLFAPVSTPLSVSRKKAHLSVHSNIFNEITTHFVSLKGSSSVIVISLAIKYFLL